MLAIGAMYSLVWFALCFVTFHYSFSSGHNKGVQQAIVAEIFGQPNCKFSEADVKGNKLFV